MRQAVLSRHSGSGASGQAPARPALVMVHRVTELDFADRIEAVGTLHAKESADLSANVTETLTGLLFEDGKPVQAGDLLATLDSAEEEAMLQAAKAELAEQEREIRRLEDLVRQGAVPAIRLEERETQAEIARRRLQEVEARIADRRVLATFNGIAGLRRISVGALVTPGTVIVTLDQIATMNLDFPVPETFLSSLQPGLPIVASSPAFPGRPFEGRVSQVDSRIDPATRAVTVRAEIPNPQLTLRPGMLMTTVLHRNPRRSPAVPERAILPLGRESFVFVVRRDPDDSKPPVAERVLIALSTRLPGFAEAISGVAAGEDVITDAYIGLATGAPVETAGTYEGPSPAYNPRKE